MVSFALVPTSSNFDGATFPIPTFPLFKTWNKVVVAKAAVEEPMLNTDKFAFKFAGVAKIERVLVGVVVPIPKLPLTRIVA